MIIMCFMDCPPPPPVVSRREYLALVASVPFVACVHGGGLDPSPKAWEALLVGTIPIIGAALVLTLTLNDVVGTITIIDPRLID